MRFPLVLITPAAWIKADNYICVSFTDSPSAVDARDLVLTQNSAQSAQYKVSAMYPLSGSTIQKRHQNGFVFNSATAGSGAQWCEYR
jgi:hypothetical protein